jgi:hypothetical protein
MSKISDPEMGKITPDPNATGQRSSGSGLIRIPHPHNAGPFVRRLSGVISESITKNENFDSVMVSPNPFLDIKRTTFVLNKC